MAVAEHVEEPIVGPDLAPRSRSKRPLQFEQAYLDSLPSANMYEKSYMHRDVVTHVAVSAADFFISGSADAGYVLAELLLGQPLFSGENAVDQLVEIIKVLGTPTDFRFPQIKAHHWHKVHSTFESPQMMRPHEAVAHPWQYPTSHGVDSELYKL